MAKKLRMKFKNNPLSQLLIIATILVVIMAVFEAVTQNDFTSVAPTQLFIVAGVLGVLGLYLKDEKF
jgi:membrane protein insertase Oxa1/YidC/SpoIIIJ